MNIRSGMAVRGYLTSYLLGSPGDLTFWFLVLHYMRKPAAVEDQHEDVHLQNPVLDSHYHTLCDPKVFRVSSRSGRKSNDQDAE